MPILISFAHDNVSFLQAPISQILLPHSVDDVSLLPTHPQLTQKLPLLCTCGFLHLLPDVLLPGASLVPVQCRLECWEINISGATLKKQELELTNTAFAHPKAGYSYPI